MKLDDIPTIVSAYKCKKCGVLFENLGDEETIKKVAEHCRKPVVELPTGLVLRTFDMGEGTHFIILTDSEEFATKDHYSRHSVVDFNPNRGAKGLTEHVYRGVSAREIIKKFMQFKYKPLDPENQEWFSGKYASDLARELKVPEFIVDLSNIPVLRI